MESGAQLAALMAQSTIIDLSVLIAEDLPASWPTHMPFQAKVWNWYEARPRDAQPVRSVYPYQTRWWAIDEHCGTHFDAPTHFVPPPDSGLPHANEWGAMTGDRVPPERLMGPLAVVDLRYLQGKAEPGMSPRIEPDDFRRWEEQHGPLRPEEAVALWTGWDERYQRGEAGRRYSFDPFVLNREPGWPAPSMAAIDYLHQRGIRLVVTDGASVSTMDDSKWVHWAGLERGILYVESVCNLGLLPPRGAYFIFLPVKVEGSTGGPGRAIAIVPRAAS